MLFFLSAIECDDNLLLGALDKQALPGVYDHVHGHHFDHQKGATFLCQMN